MSRADKLTIEAKKREVYSDFTTNFDANPFTGLLARVTNEESVQQSLKNITLTMTGERFYDSFKGSKIRQSLFELYDDTMIEVIKIQLSEAYAAYEPRAIINDIRLDPLLESNEYAVTVVFSVINIPNSQFQLSLNVSRIR